MATIGVRVQFYETRHDGTGREDYVGAMTKERAFTAQSVPGVGDLIASRSLSISDGGQQQPLLFTKGGYPFHQVRDVEHYLAPVDSDKEPTAVVVLHTALGHEGERLVAFIRNHLKAGWSWYTGNSLELAEAWTAAQTQLAEGAE